MDWEVIAPMIVATILILTVGGVMVLRPLSKRFAELLEVYTQDRQKGVGNELHQMRELLETMDARLRLMEERQDFTDRLLQASHRERAPEHPGEGEGQA